MRWLLKGHVKEMEGPYEQEEEHPSHPWWQVMCLTGVDYFSTLGYQPGIAFLAAGALSPIATLVLVLLTLFGALPMYKRVAEQSPYGDGSISMLENLLPWWQGKLFVLTLIGFAATGFIITITLSAADATAHIIENPYAPHAFHGQEVAITLVLIALLGAVFLKGFGEAIGIAVGIVVVYILLNLIVLFTGFMALLRNPAEIGDWTSALFRSYPNPLMMVAAAMLVFPRLALGLSGFETGVVVMPLVKGDPTDTHEQPAGRIRNTRKLLTTAALIMSFLLICSSIITTTLIPPEEFRAPSGDSPAGGAYGRALAYLAHHQLGSAFGTVYDLSTIMILWFAGSSAMAGLLNIVPRYLPRYGMAPEWTRATRPLVLIYTAVCFLVTWMFRADVEAQAGAYATGVLALMTSATIAVLLFTRRIGDRTAAMWFSVVTVVFVFTLVVNIWDQPGGLQIALIFIGSIVATSLISRAWRTTELRVDTFKIDERALQFLEDVAREGEIRIIANKKQAGDASEYRLKEREQCEYNHIPDDEPILFLEVTVCDASEFTDVMDIQGVEIRDSDERFRVLRAEASTVPNAIAAFAMYLRDRYGKPPHIYFSWSETNPLVAVFRYVLLGEGDTAPVTHEVLRQAEPDPKRRPFLHVGGG
ncbi:MAG: amino acid transporter [Armatimonadetes bacterium]|nr:amino acid transporter [Armatimonadota bacterium]